MEQPDPLDEQEADSATAYEADDRGKAYVDIPTVDREGDKRWKDLWHDGVDDRLQPIGARRLDRLDRPWIDALDRF